MLANGWMTRFITYDFDDGVDYYGWIYLVVFIVHMMMGGYSVIENDQYHKYHNYSGILGLLMILVKLILMGVFVWFYEKTRQILQKAQKPFFRQIFYIGTIYLLCGPFVIITSFLLDEMNRESYFRFIDQSVHICIQVYLLY